MPAPIRRAHDRKRLRRYKSRLKDRSARKAYAASRRWRNNGAGLDAQSYVIEAPAEGMRRSPNTVP
jgi:hypothetical protein